MDPLSFTASAITVVGFLSQSCLSVFDFLPTYSDAPVNIKIHHLALRALHADLRKIQDLNAKNPSILELSPEFSALVPELLADFLAVETKLRKIRAKFDQGKGTKVWARVIWSLSSEQWLGKFLDRVQIYQTVFNSELMLVYTKFSIARSNSLVLPTSPQTPSQQQAVHALIDQHPKTISYSPFTNLVTTNAENQGVICTQSTNPVKKDIESNHGTSVAPAQYETSMNDQAICSSADRSSFMLFLENFLEPSSVKSIHFHLYEAKWVSLALQFGPLIVKRFSPQQKELYEISPGGYYGINATISSPLYLLHRVSFSLFAIRQSYQCLSFSLRWNIAFSRVVPNSASIVKLTRAGDITAIEDLFESGKASPSDVKPDGTTLLHIAALTNNYRLVDYFLKKGLNANMPNNQGETPLYFAIAHSSDYNISRLLIDKGADLNHSCLDGSSPLHTFFNDVVSRVLLCHSDHLEAPTKNGLGRTPLHYLAWSSRSTPAEAKIYLSSDPSALLARDDDDDRTPLHYAARRGNVDLVRYFLSLKPSHELRELVDRTGQTAVHLATESKRAVGVLDALLQKGGRDDDDDIMMMMIFRRDRNGRSVLHHAARHGNVDAVKRVLATMTGADLERELQVRDKDGKTPFLVAKENGAGPVAEHLQSSSAHGVSLAAISRSPSSGSRQSRRHHHYYKWKDVVFQVIIMHDMAPAAIIVAVICIIALAGCGLAWTTVPKRIVS